MRKEIGPNLWAPDMPDTSVYEVVMNIDQGHEDEGVALEASVGIVERLINPDEDKEARET
jgi:hypothetical protein